MNRKVFAGLAFVALIFGTTVVGAQDHGYTLEAGSVTVQDGGSADIDILLSNDGATAGDLQGWSYGLCHDMNSVVANAIGDGDTATIKNGGPVDFNER